MRCFILLTLTFVGEFPSHAFPSLLSSLRSLSPLCFFMFLCFADCLCGCVFEWRFIDLSSCLINLRTYLLPAPLEVGTPLRLEWSGGLHKLPIGSGQSPAAKRILVHFRPFEFRLLNDRSNIVICGVVDFTDCIPVLINLGIRQIDVVWLIIAPVYPIYHSVYSCGTRSTLSLSLFVLLLAILYDHMIMYVGLLGHSAVVFHVLKKIFFSCFYVLMTVWVKGLCFFSDILLIYSAV